MNTLKKWGWRVALTSCVLALAACGGRDAPPPVTQMYVMGDSLADAGTIAGQRFTVTDSDAPAAANIYPLQLAARVGLDPSAHCSYYFSDGTQFGLRAKTGCSNYAVAGAQIIYAGDATDPRHITTQLAARANAGVYAATDLVLIDGGGNDLAELVEAFLDESTNGASRKKILDRLPPPSGSVFGSVLGVEESYYMSRLAEVFYSAIKQQVLDKGAQRVVVLNIPNILQTPRFKARLANLSDTRRTELNLLGPMWASAFNTRLADLLAKHEKEVAVVNFSALLTDMLGAPEKHGLRNTTDPVCTVDATFGKFPCWSKDLDARAGSTPGWWKTHVFADNFHPTPAAHQVLADAIAKAMADKGWL